MMTLRGDIFRQTAELFFTFKSRFGSTIRFHRFCIAALLLSQFSPPCTGALVTRIIHNPGDSVEPFVISWDSEPGAAYDVLAVDALGEQWKPINTAPVVADGNSAEFRDRAGSTARFYIVLRRTSSDDSPAEGPAPRLFPSQANLLPGRSQPFQALFPDATELEWTIEASEGTGVGTISESGVYVAPATVPDMPLVVIRATQRTGEKLSAIALVTLLAPEFFAITRDQAIQVLTEKVIQPLPNSEGVIAFGSQQMLTPNDNVVPALPYRQGTIQGNRPANTGSSPSDPYWFFMVELNPEKIWAHDVRYVCVDAQSGEIVQDRLEEWFPRINGIPQWVSLESRKTDPDRVFVGNTIAEAFELDEQQTAVAAAHNVSTMANDTLAEIDLFPSLHEPACQCSEPPRRLALVIGDDSPSAALGTSIGSAFLGFFGGADTEERVYNGALLMTEMLRAQGFEVTDLLSETETSTTEIIRTFARLRKRVRPCDTLVVFVSAHGTSEGVGRLNYPNYSRLLGLAPTHSKYFIVDSCYSGAAIDIMSRTERGIPNPTAFIIASAARTEGANAQFKAKVFDPDGLKPLAFVNGFLTCLKGAPNLKAAVDCAIALDPNIRSQAPQVALVQGVDSDADGILDADEAVLGTDPQNPDSDGDQICDGIEFSQVPLTSLRLQYQRPAIRSMALAHSAVGESYFAQLSLVSHGTRANSNPPSEINPFGAGPKNGWSVLPDTPLPAGLTFNRQNGRLSGILEQPGKFNFTIEYMDAIGSTTRHEFSLTVYGLPSEAPRTIYVTTTADGNVRDDDLSLREAIMLANGELKIGDLRVDPDPDNRIAEGEVRWIQEGGILIGGGTWITAGGTLRTRVNEFVLSSELGPLILNGQNIKLYLTTRDTVVAAQGPAIVVGGQHNRLDNTWKIRVSKGPAVVVQGNRNLVGLPMALTQRPSLELTGGGGGAGIVITGNENQIGGSSLAGFSEGIRLQGTATANQILRMRIADCGDGIVLTNQAEFNSVRECAVGFHYESRVPVADSISGNGIVLSGGARWNQIEENGIAGAALNGILVTGESTSLNVIADNLIGTAQGSGSLAGDVEPNRGDGIRIEKGAQQNSISGGRIVGNLGHGIHLTGTGTRSNWIGNGDIAGVEIDSTALERDAVRIDDGATGNVISITVTQSARHGIALVDNGTSANQVTTRWAGNLRAKSQIRNAASAGLFIADGATNNVVDEADIALCSEGIVISGIGTRSNAIQSATVISNVAHGIRLSGGSEFNSIGSTAVNDDQRARNTVVVDGNGGTGVVIEGAATSGNVIERVEFGRSVPNALWAIDINSGARNNTVANCEIRVHRAGGIQITGTGTDGNRIESTAISGARLTADRGQSGAGLRIAGGASGNLIEHNIIENSGADGILIDGATTIHNVVTANSISRSARAGIRISDGQQNTIGAPDVGNLIFLNNGEGVRIDGGSAIGNRILGNEIGRLRAPNGSHGILISSGAKNNTIGGARPVIPDPRSPQVLLPPSVDDRGAGNIVNGNVGDGIRISGSGTSHNKILGNLIGFPVDAATPSQNGGNGIANVDGANDNCIGNCVSLADSLAGYGNVIGTNANAGIWIDSSSGITIRRNEIYPHPGGRIRLTNGANGNVRSPGIFIDIGPGRLSGNVPSRGFIEVYSDFIDDLAVYHLTAVVGPGEFQLNPFNPRENENAFIIDSTRPLRRGTQLINFTEERTGNSSEFTILP